LRSARVAPGGPNEQHFSYSTKIHFFSRIGAYHPTLSKAAEKRLLDSTHVDIGPAHKKEKDFMEKNVFGTMRRLVADPAALNGPLTTWIPRIMFLLLPGYAFILTIFYWFKRKKFFFVDHLVFSLSVHTFGFVLLLGAAAAAQVMAAEYVALATVLIAAVYAFIAMKRFYEQGWIWTTVKFVLVSSIYICFFALPALIGALVMSVLGGSSG